MTSTAFLAQIQRSPVDMKNIKAVVPVQASRAKTAVSISITRQMDPAVSLREHRGDDQKARYFMK